MWLLENMNFLEKVVLNNKKFMKMKNLCILCIKCLVIAIALIRVLNAFKPIKKEWIVRILFSKKLLMLQLLNFMVFFLNLVLELEKNVFFLNKKIGVHSCPSNLQFCTLNVQNK